MSYDPIIVLPILLIVSIFVAFVALGFHLLLVATEQTCSYCGRAFSTMASRVLHEKGHETGVVSLAEEREAGEAEKAA